MSGQVDIMAEYVRRRLEHWGEEFALSRDVEYLGFSSTNLLHVLMQHHGMPGRTTGYKPLETDAQAQQIEDIVSEIARHSPVMGWVLRAYYCGQGRRKFERHETANMLLASAGLPPLGRSAYMELAARGTERVLGMLMGSTMPAG